MDYLPYFQQLLINIPQHSSISSSQLSHALIHQLNIFIHNSNQTTISGLLTEINHLANYIIHQIQTHSLLNRKSSISLYSALAIYKQYLNRNFPQLSDLSLLKNSLFDIGQKYCQTILGLQQKIQNHSLQLMKNGAVIMVVGYSKVLEQVLISASQKGFRFRTILPDVQVLQQTLKMNDVLLRNNIQTVLIPFTSLGFYMDEIDYVMTGAQAVVENGGIINTVILSSYLLNIIIISTKYPQLLITYFQIGTQLIAMSAQFYRKPVYVVCETIKFTKIYPLNQKDIPKQLLYNSNHSETTDNPMCDYTQPNLISLLITDKGIFTPHAVTDQLFMIFEQ